MSLFKRLHCYWDIFLLFVRSGYSSMKLREQTFAVVLVFACIGEKRRNDFSRIFGPRKNFFRNFFTAKKIQAKNLNEKNLNYDFLLLPKNGFGKNCIAKNLLLTF